MGTAWYYELNLNVFRRSNGENKRSEAERF
jgi:hypothetical protein